MRFEWDPEKGKTNKQKHRISFEDAQSVFYDENGRYMADPDDQGEERFLILGLNSMANTLVVCHCYRQAGQIIRIISARSHEERGNPILGANQMRKEYDFSKSKRNPYAKALKKQITIRLDEPTIEYFRKLAGETGLPYQSVMNLYLRDCAAHHRRLSWAA